MIIYEMNERFCKWLFENYTTNLKKISAMAIISYDRIHMANLCLSTCYAINGVSRLHTEILKNDVFSDFYNIQKDKFFAITNGVTHRRWLLKANPLLSDLISETIGNEFITDAKKLIELKKFADDKAFQEKFASIKRQNKIMLAKYILDKNNIKVNLDSIFDVQVKRLHEYKRQLLNVLHILYEYNKILESPNDFFYPKTYIFGAKASPGYFRAKQIIKLINSVSEKINNDERVFDKLKVVFIENYGVSIAEKIIPAAEISEQISTAGLEASGTGNMKFMLNGALTIGTYDGANIEILEQVSEDNIYIFGLKAIEVKNICSLGLLDSQKIYAQNAHIKKALDMLIDKSLEPNYQAMFLDIYNSLLFGEGMADCYMVLRDFESYVKIHERAAADYHKPEIWNKKAIINVAQSGYFSSDRTIMEYNNYIWKIKN